MSMQVQIFKTKTTLWLIIALTAWHILEIESCNSLPAQNRKKGGRCICGSDKDSHTGKYHWNLNIIGIQGICSGTIVTSNLLITSGQCLAAVGAANSKHNGLVISGHKKETFPVLEIIRNDKSDLVLIHVKADFTRHSYHFPVCILEGNANINLVHRPAFFTGLTTDLDGNTIYVQNEGIILRGKECDKEATFNVDTGGDLLCMRYDGLSDPPDFPGGPLLVKSKRDGKRSFLLGFTFWVGESDEISGTGYNYIYFSNGIPLIRHLEKAASTYKSTWCTTPKLTMQSETNKGILGGPWPYEKEDVQLSRDESLNCVCGLENENKGRVIGGVETDPYEYGWMAKVFYNWEGFTTLCGATVINDRMILTTAHCVVSEDVRSKKKNFLIAPENVEVYIGAHDLWDDPRDKRIKIKNVIFWPEYANLRIKYNIHDWDIALLITEEPIKFSKDVTGYGKYDIRPVCIPKPGAKLNLIGETAWVTGWGYTNPDVEELAEELRKVELPIQPLRFCSKVAPKETFTDRMLCAGTNDRNKDSAKGDSGGPLTMLRDDGLWTQIGMVSWGKDLKGHKGATSISLYSNLQRLVSFVDYNAMRIGAKWCRSSL